LAVPERRAITLEHLLTMSSGLAWHEGGEGPDDEHRLMWKWSPAYYVLSRPVAAAPGARFNYNSGGTLLLADVLQRATGMAWKDYARTALFEPLGITQAEWVGDFLGRPMAYTGLRLRPRDLARLGRLVLDHGRWRGRQLVPEAWIAASLQPRRDTGFDGMGYGYFWWTGTAPWQGRTVAWAAAFGNGGQRLFVVPALDLAVVITAGAYGDAAAARRVNGHFREIVATVRR
jgi:CubicO group peptidase (beta-lactamase class C family)